MEPKALPRLAEVGSHWARRGWSLEIMKLVGALPKGVGLAPLALESPTPRPRV